MSQTRPQQPDLAAIEAALSIGTNDEHGLDDFVMVADTRPATVNTDPDDFVIINDTAPLLPPDQVAPAPGWPTRAMTHAKHAAASVGNTALYVVKHPATTLVSFATALPTAVYAFVGPLHQRPNVISLEWWNSLTTLQQANAAIHGLSSQSLNTLVNMVFLPQSWEDISKTVPHTFDSKRQFSINFIKFLLANSAALATGMIARNAFLFLPAASVTAFIPATLSFLSAFASRYVGVTNSFRRVNNLFSDNVHVQKEFLDILQHLDAETLARLQAEFQNIIDNVTNNPRNVPDGDSPPSKPLTKGQFYELTKQLAAKLDEVIRESVSSGKHPIKEASISEKAKDYAGFFTDLTLSTAIAMGSLAIHMQKGSDAILLLSSGKLDHANIWLKRTIGMTPSIAPAMLNFVCGMEIRTTLLAMAKEVYKKPSSLPLAILLLISNGLAASSMQSVSEGIVTNPDNIIGITDKDSWLAATFIALATMGAAVTNGKPSIELSFKHDPATLATLTYEEYVKHLRNYQRNTISDGTRTALRTLSIFDKTKPGVVSTSRPSSSDLEAQAENTSAPTFAGGR